jgi:ABC-2 type transport system permease protein
MAGLDTAPVSGIPASSQFAAIARLRWYLFRNSFRRKGATGEIVARIIMVPAIAVLVVGPIVAGGAAAYFAVSKGQLNLLAMVFWAIFLLQILVSFNIAQPGLSFDPEQLIRYPLSFPRYLTIRIFLGLLSTSTVIGTLALGAAAIGGTVAQPSLGPILFIAALSLALANMLFIRMIFAWVDRWLSTRRARELFTGLIILLSIGFQYLNLTFNPGFAGSSAVRRTHNMAVIKHLYSSGEPLLHRLPPGFAAMSVVEQANGHLLLAGVNLAGVLCFALIFLAIFALRMRREFSGENLSEAGARPQAAPAPTASPRPAIQSVRTDASTALGISLGGSTHSGRRLGLTPAMLACLLKEFIYLRRNTAQFYAVLGPLAMVLLFSSRMGRYAPVGYNFPAAVVYATLGISALSYNVFGLDATGVQFYFLAPTSFRTIILAKNLLGFLFAAVDVILIYLVITFMTGRPPLSITLITLVWAALAVFINTTVGNIRSFTAPKKLDPAKIGRKQTSQMSALLAVGLMLLTAAAGFGLVFLSRNSRMLWLPLPVLLIMAVIAFEFYIAGLARVDRLAAIYRDSLLDELTRHD